MPATTATGARIDTQAKAGCEHHLLFPHLFGLGTGIIAVFAAALWLGGGNKNGAFTGHETTIYGLAL